MLIDIFAPFSYAADTDIVRCHASRRYDGHDD